MTRLGRSTLLLNSKAPEQMTASDTCQHLFLVTSSIGLVLQFRCLHKMAPEYLSTYCQPVSGIFGRRHLRSVDRGHLDFPRVKLASYGGRSFAYAGPSNWNSLPAYLKDIVFLFHLLSTTSKHFCSLSTRLAHVVRLGFFYKKTRYINSLLLLLLLLL